MLMQPGMPLSPYLALYDIIVPPDHKLRKIKQLVNFSFVYDELKKNYCTDNGRGAIDPIRMFKYLFLKAMYNLSDLDLVERTRCDLSFKYFLDMAPEENVIDSSSLTKFRKQRLKNMDILDLLIGKTVSIALEKGIITGKAIIVDSTHTKARYNLLSHHDALFERANSLRQTIRLIDREKASQLPVRPQTDSSVSDVLQYSEELLKIVYADERLQQYPGILEKMHILEETVADTLENRCISADPEAKVGHKTSDSSFYGYKTHIAMTEDRIITAAVITTGERSDGKQLQELVEKSEAAGVNIEEVIGDMAYSERKNQQYTEGKKIQLISKTNKMNTYGRRHDDKFEYNKDAGMYVCPAGHMSTHKQTRRSPNGRSPKTTYIFDIEKCRVCPLRDPCFKGTRCKTYSVRLDSDDRTEQMQFEESEYFRARAKARYKIEAKNSELKQAHGYKTAQSAGLESMQLQGAMAIFAVNIKRILKLTEIN